MLDKFKRAELIVLGGVILLFVTSFLPWFEACGGVAGFRACASGNGWDDPRGWTIILAVLLSLGIGVVVVLDRATQVNIPPRLGNFTWPQVHVAAGAVSALLVLIKFLGKPSGGGIVDVSYSFGSFVGLIAAAGLVVGAVMNFREAPAPSGPALPPPPPPSV